MPLITWIPPAFQDRRADADRLLADAQDKFNVANWRAGAGPTPAQADAANLALQHIASARDALARAAL